MANYRIPGPICQTRLQWPISDGTQALWLTPQPGSICATAPHYIIAGNRNRDLEFLFLECRNPGSGLSDDDYKAAASALGVEIEAIKAIAEVETSGAAFDEAGRPRILYERHYFHRLTAGKYSSQHPLISNATAGGYGKFSAQYDKLEQAYKLDQDAALRSASWGRFQIMGDNFGAAGFTSVKDFVFALTRAESEHLKAFTHFIGSNKKMLTALRKKNWATFAAAYNGPGYRKNSYDTKLAAAYLRFKATPAVAGKP